MMPGNLLVWFGVAALAFFGGWETQGWRRDSQEKERVEAQAETDRLAHLANSRRQTVVIEAQNAAASRAAAAKRDAADARSELDRLRDVSDAAIAAARISSQACIDNAIAFADVFSQCVKRYSELGEAADGHANDAKTLSDSWPK